MNSEGLPECQSLHHTAQSQEKAVLAGKALGSHLWPLRLRQEIASVC